MTEFKTPEDATHYERTGEYLKIELSGEVYRWSRMVSGGYRWWKDDHISAGIRSLSDIKRIAELETDIHNLQRNLEAKDQGRCRTINEMSGMIRNLQEQLKAAQAERISIKNRVNEIERMIATNEMTAAQVFTQMRQLIPAPPEK